MINEYILNDGRKVKINTRLTMRTLREVQDEGLLSKDILLRVADLNTQDLDEFELIQKLDISEIYNAPYIAYKNANYDGMSRDEFEANIFPDLQKSADIYMEIISNIATGGESQMSKSFKNNTRPQRNNNKKKYQK